MTTPTAPANPKAPIEATADSLAKFLTRRPVLWVGAGASVAAGYPGTGDLIRGMVAAADDPIDPDLPFFEVADRFVAGQGEGDLGDVLQSLLGPPRDPARLHLALARLAKAGSFHAIVTTNYDDLLERVLSDADVPFVLQPLEENAPVKADGHLRLFKLHGSRDDWAKVILSSGSYEAFNRRFPFLVSQLDVLLRQHPVLFVGCSLLDPRILDWLAGLTPEAASRLKPWRPLMTQSAWDAALAHPSGALAQGSIRPFLLKSHAHLGEILGEVATAQAPDLTRLEIEVTVGDRWQARMEGCPSWKPADLLADADLRKDLEKLRELGVRSLPTDERGRLSKEAASAMASLLALAASIGDRLTEGLLSPEARKRLEAAIHAGAAGSQPLLLLKVRPEAAGPEEELRADQALALPWELLRLEGRFPVEAGTLDLAREAVVDGVPGLTPPDRPLSIVATVASPVDENPFNYEEEMYLLWRALGEAREEKRLLVTDLGTLGDLAGAVERYRAPVVHFTGHGRPGVLLFEDEEATGDPVDVGELIRRFKETGPPPRLFYLSACHGTTAGAALDGARRGERMVDNSALGGIAPSTAASLHRSGFPQVVAYLGPVGDRQATRAAATFYQVLGRGLTAWEALRQARRVSSEPLKDGGRATHVYPLGWAQLALYHRGAGHPTALPPSTGAPKVDLPREERKRVFQRLDRKGGSRRVEGIAGVQRLLYGFVGRRRERAEAIRRWRAGERFLVVQGLGGLGKTTLCAEVALLLAQTLGESIPVLALDGRYAGSQAEPVAALWQEVQAAGSGEGWNQVLADLQKDGLTPEALARAILILGKAAGGLLLYLDDAESLQVQLGQGEVGNWRDPGFARFWELLVGAAEEGGPFGILASSRYQPDGTPPEAVLPLSEMSRYEVVRLLSWMPTLGQMPAQDRAWVAEQVEGHPRTVEYLEALARETILGRPRGRYSGGNWRQDILRPLLPKTEEKVGADLLLGKLWETLPSRAREHLGRCSVLSQPVPWEAIDALEAEKGTGKRLMELGLLSPILGPSGDEWWAPHRLVIEEASRQWGGEPKDAHRLWGEWFEKRFETEKTLDWAAWAVEHFLSAGEADHAWPTARWLVLKLRSAGRFREALGWLERVLAVEPTGGKLGMALTIQAQLQELAGILTPTAEKSLLRALELVEREDQAFVLAELGSFYEQQGLLDEAADYLERAVEAGKAVTEEGEVRLQMAVWLHNLAGVLVAKGDLSGARERLEKSLALEVEVRETEIHSTVAESLHELARVLILQQDLEGALKRLERAIAIKEQVYGTREHYSIALSETNLGFIFQKQGATERAGELYSHAHTVFLKQLGHDHPHTRKLARYVAGAEAFPPKEPPS